MTHPHAHGLAAAIALLLPGARCLTAPAYDGTDYYEVTVYFADGRRTTFAAPPDFTRWLIAQKGEAHG